MPYRAVNLARVRTYPLPDRHSRVALEHLVMPDAPVPAFESSDLDEVAERIAAARQNGRPVIWMIGAHVVKRGLAPLLDRPDGARGDYAPGKQRRDHHPRF